AVTYQELIDPNQLSALHVGNRIGGMGFRLATVAGYTDSWPPVDITWSGYQVVLSTSPNDVAHISNTFANNIGADAVTVRDGPLTLPTNSFVGGAVFPDINPFYLMIPFSTPFTYNGGTLSVTIRHKDSDATSGGARFLEAPNVAGSGPTLGYDCRAAD